MLVRPGTYFNPQTEVVVVVDDSTSIDQEVFNMEAYEGSDWVRISDDVPVDEDGRDADARGVPDPLPRRHRRLRLRDRARAGRRYRRRGGGREPRSPDGRTDGRLLSRQARGRRRLDGAVPRLRGDALVHGCRSGARAGRVHLAGDAARTPAARAATGTATRTRRRSTSSLAARSQFKVGDDVFEAGPSTAVRVGTEAFCSVHNDGPDEAELIIVSTERTRRPSAERLRAD